MIGRLRASGLLWPTLFTLPVFCILVVLGNWQWDRLHWKQGLLRDLQQAASADPVPMRIVPNAAAVSSQADIEALRFRRITVEGAFEHGQEMHVWAPAASGPAWSVVTPLRLQLDAAGKTGLARAQASHVLVIRGIVPAASKDPATRKAGQVPGVQKITGRIRIDQPNTWANAPNIRTNQWFTRDLAAMTAHLRTSAGATVAVAPFFLEAEDRIGGPAAPTPQLIALNVSNRHLEYALTWWALAATLVAVYATFAWTRLNQAKS